MRADFPAPVLPHRIRQQYLSHSEMVTCINARSARRLILLCKHDGQDPGGLIRVGWVFRPPFHRGVVVVDLPEDSLASDRDAAEVVFPIGVVLWREVLEALHQAYCLGNKCCAPLPDAACQVNRATLTSLTECIVELGDDRRARFSNMVVHSDIS